MTEIASLHYPSIEIISSLNFIQHRFWIQSFQLYTPQILDSCIWGIVWKITVVRDGVRTLGSLTQSGTFGDTTTYERLSKKTFVTVQIWMNPGVQVNMATSRLCWAHIFEVETISRAEKNLNQKIFFILGEKSFWKFAMGKSIFPLENPIISIENIDISLKY